MNKKILYAIIAVVVVIILIVAVLEAVVLPTHAASLTASVSSSSASVGQTLTFAAFISGGTPSKVMFNFGDGITGSATLLTGNEYTVAHSYSSAGKYLVTANATVNGKIVNNLQGIFEVSVTPSAASPTIASEITVPSIITSTQIISPGSTVSLTASTLQPPTATNWTIGYYIWSFGDGATRTNYTVFNTSSGSFMAGGISHLYSTGGIYAVTLGVITFNATNYVPTTYTSNGINYTYYPLSDLTSILSSSGNYYNNTYVCTLVVNSTAKLLTSTVPLTNPSEIIVTQVAPGGPFSFDPAIAPGTIDLEIVQNVYESLIQYNGTSSTMIPIVAKEVPTVQNGLISNNGLNYTFNIRSGLKFSNGDSLTAWDVYVSFIRLLLFAQGIPGTDTVIFAIDLLHNGGYAPGALSYQNVTSAITLNNATQSVTFHLLKADPGFLERLSSLWGMQILDDNWLVAHGAGITFTPAGFAAYMNQGNETDYNNYVRYNPMGSGPYMVKTYLIGQSISLVPNPYFTPIAGVSGYNHTANNTIYIQWEKDPATALLLAKSGQTDIVTGLPNNDYPIMSQLQSQGKIQILTFSTTEVSFYNFNFDVNETLLSSLGSGYSVPQYYFANQDVRRAWADAFNYTNYINNLLGNKIYGANFGSPYTGLIPYGMPGYLNVTKLKQAGTVVPTYNLSIAKQYMYASGLYNTTINIPIIVWAGDPIDFAAATDWAETMNSIDPNIHASALYMEYSILTGYMVPIQNPMPIYFMEWVPPWDFPSATESFLYLAGEYGGYYPPNNGINSTNLINAGYTTEAQEWQSLQSSLLEADNSTNLTNSLIYFDQAEQKAINMTLYVYIYQPTGIYFVSSSIRGMQMEMNPITNEGLQLFYYYLTKK